jgi:DNA-binding transcriptional ArsR family regulator
MRNRQDRRGRPAEVLESEVRHVHAEDVARARELIEDADHESLAELFGALSDPTRLRIVHILLQQEMCTADLADALSMSDPAVSQHLRVLRDLGLVGHRRAGRMVYYSVDDRHIARLVRTGLRRQGRVDPGTRLGRPRRAAQGG